MEANYTYLTELTSREKEVFKLVAEGFSNKEIADKLGISLYTVKSHLATIFDKFGVNSRHKLTKIYYAKIGGM